MDDDRLTDLGPSGGGEGEERQRLRGASCRGAFARSSSRCPLAGSACTGPTPRCAGRSCGDRGLSCPTRTSSCAITRRHPLIDAGSWSLSVFGTGLRGSVPAGPGRCGSATRTCWTCRPARWSAPSSARATAGASSLAQQGQPVPGTPWRLGAIGVAAWRGVPLSVVLERAGITREAVDVMPSGLDPDLVMAGVSYGRVRRPIPVAKALDDVILAYEMNGEPLPPDHGYPVRVIVPRWAGIASIKWVGADRGLRHSRWSPTGTPGLPAVRPGLPGPAERSSPPSRSGARSNSTGTRGCPRTRSTCSPGGPGRAAGPSPAPRSAPTAGGTGTRPSRATPAPRPAWQRWEFRVAHSRPGVIHAAGPGHRPNRRHPVRDRPRQHLRIPLRRHSRASRQHGLTAGSAPKRQATMLVLSGTDPGPLAERT